MSDLRGQYDALDRAMSRLRTEDEKISAVVDFLDNVPHDELATAKRLPGGSDVVDPTDFHGEAATYMQTHGKHLRDVLVKHDISPAKLKAAASRTPDGAVAPLRNLLCASHDVSSRKFCLKEGTQSCTGCRLVRYCSKECQRSHWPAHKSDCKNSMNSKAWRPGWEREGRQPAFVNNIPPSEWQTESFGMNMILWGNVPAIDIVNGPHSEGGLAKLKTRDLSLAFVASGDLRNVIKTVNSLPDDYNAKLKLLLNDRNPIIVARNFIILAILAELEDTDEAVEFALHQWYSIFLPIDYSVKVSRRLIVHDLLKRARSHTTGSLTSTTDLTAIFSDQDTLEMIYYGIAPNSQAVAAASNALNSVMHAPSRVDYRDRFYTGLHPPHRVASQQWRQFGLVMPFGAVNAHLNLPNPTLVTPDGSIFLKDNASPLNGWDIADVLKSGRAHGTTEEDLIGCLHFHIKDQLHEFVRRLRRFNISIRMYDQDALTLPADLPGDWKSFDRVEVSNIVDKEYADVPPVLEAWGPLLNRKMHDSALIGLFMNWAMTMPDGNATRSQPAAIKAMRARESNSPESRREQRQSGLLSGPTSGVTAALLSSLNLFYDNSEIFREYLKVVKADEAAQRVGLKLRTKNQIVPYRIGVATGDPWSVLPDVRAEDRWYNMVALSGLSYTERYVEWSV